MMHGQLPLSASATIDSLAWFRTAQWLGSHSLAWQMETLHAVGASPQRICCPDCGGPGIDVPELDANTANNLIVRFKAASAHARRARRARRR